VGPRGSEMPATFWNELDFEKFGGKCRLQTNPLYGAPLVDHGEIATVAGDLCNGYHPYPFEWTPEYIAWLVDGVEVRREAGEPATAFATKAAHGTQIHFNISGSAGTTGDGPAAGGTSGSPGSGASAGGASGTGGAGAMPGVADSGSSSGASEADPASPAERRRDDSGCGIAVVSEPTPAPAAGLLGRRRPRRSSPPARTAAT